MGEQITCPECGFRNQLGDEFCGQCGRYLGWSTSSGPGDQSTLPDTPPPATVSASDLGPRSSAPPQPPVPQQALDQTRQPPPQPPVPQQALDQTRQPPPQPPVPQQSAAPPQFLAPSAMGGVTCRTCGLVNPTGRTFCQRCGNELDPAVGTVAGTPRPVAGASSGQGGSGGRTLMVAGLGLVVVAVVAGAAIVFGGVLGGPSPTATLETAVGSPSPAAPTAAQTPDGTPSGATIPTETPTPRPTRRPTEAPTATPTGEPTGAPLPTVGGPTPAPAGTFECARTTAIPDPRSEGWRVQRVNWSNQGAWDRLVVTLNQFDALAGDATQAIVHVLPVDEVAETLKVVAPSAGRDAIALGLWQGVRFTLTLDQQLSLPKLRWVTVGKDDNDFGWIVLGVRGAACYSLQVPAWSSDDPGDTSSIEVIVDIAH